MTGILRAGPRCYPEAPRRRVSWAREVTPSLVYVARRCALTVVTDRYSRSAACWLDRPAAASSAAAARAQPGQTPGLVHEPVEQLLLLAPLFPSRTG